MLEVSYLGTCMQRLTFNYEANLSLPFVPALKDRQGFEYSSALESEDGVTHRWHSHQTSIVP